MRRSISDFERVSVFRNAYLPLALFGSLKLWDGLSQPQAPGAELVEREIEQRGENYLSRVVNQIILMGTMVMFPTSQTPTG